MTKLLNIILILFAIGSFAIPAMVYSAPEGNFAGHMGTLPPDYGKPHNAAKFVPTEGCTPEIRLADTLLVVDYDNHAHKMAYDEVESRQKSKTWADNVWVVGTC